MRKFTFFLFSFFSLTLHAAVYDCFTFFNELELLHLRFEELYDVVDHFVIVESPISFTGKTKPLYYQENAERFAKYKDKVIHIVIDSFPNLTGDAEKDHWERESYSRDQIMQGLVGCDSEDIIFISDVDEIPRSTAVTRIQEYLKKFEKSTKKRRLKTPDPQLVCGLDMDLYMYHMNQKNPNGWYGGSKATFFSVVQKYTPWGIKLFHHKYTCHKIENAGWHFNTMGGQELSLYKWLNTGPIYYDGVENALLYLGENPELLNQSYQGQVAANVALSPIDDTYPKYFLDNLEHFRSLGWIVE